MPLTSESRTSTTTHSTVTHPASRPSAHDGKKQDGTPDKRVSSEHGFGKSVLIFSSPSLLTSSIHQAVTRSWPSLLERRADLPATTTVVSLSKFVPVRA